MPLYTYKCEYCEAVFDKRLPMEHAAGPVLCECGELGFRHYGKTPAVIMRPSGWNLREGDPGYDSKFEKRNIQSWMTK